MDTRYPIGRFNWEGPISAEQRKKHIDIIAATPAHLRAAVKGLSEEQLDTPYRDGGWSVRQVVHHLPDSHLNAYVRFKLTMTENEPMVKPYDEAAWARTAEVKSVPVETSVVLLEALHERWVGLLRSMTENDFARKFRHPDYPGDGKRELDWLTALYAWHGPHHVAHITLLRERMGWM